MGPRKLSFVIIDQKDNLKPRTKKLVSRDTHGVILINFKSEKQSRANVMPSYWTRLMTFWRRNKNLFLHQINDWTLMCEVRTTKCIVLWIVSSLIMLPGIRIRSFTNGSVRRDLASNYEIITYTNIFINIEFKRNYFEK